MPPCPGQGPAPSCSHFSLKHLRCKKGRPGAVGEPGLSIHSVFWRSKSGVPQDSRETRSGKEELTPATDPSHMLLAVARARVLRAIPHTHAPPSSLETFMRSDSPRASLLQEPLPAEVPGGREREGGGRADAHTSAHSEGSPRGHLLTPGQ